jgi:uncharacterized membrane protein (TIGR02234 family)
MADPDQGAGGDRREVAAVVVAMAVGGGIGVLATARTWSTIVVTRLPPLGPVSHGVSGRTLQPGVTGLAVVALAGVLAVLATRGVTRRLIGAVLALAGAGMVWWSVAGLSAVSAARGRQLVADARTVAGLGTASATNVSVHPGWVVLAALGGLLVIAGGLTTAARGGRWRAMSARYESPLGATATASDPRPEAAGGAARPREGAAGVVAHADADVAGADVAGPDVAGADVAGADVAGDRAEVARARADLALWHQLDRGEDPTISAGAVEEPARSHPTPPSGNGDTHAR